MIRAFALLILLVCGCKESPAPVAEAPVSEVSAAAATLAPAPSTSPAVRVSDISIQPEMTEALVTWTTSLPTDTAVAYGRTEEFEARKTDPLQSAVTTHKLKLTGLEPGQSYHLKVLVQAPTAPRRFTTRAATRELPQIMPRQGPRANTLTDLSTDYLKRLKSLSASEKARLEKEIRDQVPEDRIELTPAEKSELTATPTDPADPVRFERRVDLMQRWIIHLGQSGKDVEPLSRAAVTLSNQFLLSPGQAAAELDRTVKSLAAME